MRRWGVAVAAAVVVVVLAGCGGGQPTAEQRERARAAGFDVDLVYVTDIDGYSRAQAGGSGAYGDDGFQSFYADDAGNAVLLTTQRRALTATACASLPVHLAQPATAPVTCTKDGDGWRRVSGDRSEYAQMRDDVMVAASAPTATTSADLLREAVRDARTATSDELEDILPEEPEGPTERGDIDGDNAPYNPTGPGG